MSPWPLIFAVIGTLVTNATISAQEGFYKGKIVRIVTGASAGGGLDTYSRTIARHMRKYIPGNPTIVVENMPGAGGLIMVNHLAKVAKPDGLTIGNFIGDLIGLQLLGRPGVEADFLKLGYVMHHHNFIEATALTEYQIELAGALCRTLMPHPFLALHISPIQGRSPSRLIPGFAAIADPPRQVRKHLGGALAPPDISCVPGTASACRCVPAL